MGSETTVSSDTIKERKNRKEREKLEPNICIRLG
jgi:hypothetical protein